MICMLLALVSVLLLSVHRLRLVRLNKLAEMREYALGLPRGFRYIT